MDETPDMPPDVSPEVSPEVSPDTPGARNGATIHAFEPYQFHGNMPPQMRNRLKEIFAHWDDSEKSEALVREIIDEAQDTLGVRIVAYRFYFYRRRSAEAAHWALACLEWLSQRLNLPADWRTVTADMADFSRWHAYTRLWLQSLTAYSYNLARLGRQEESLAALDKVAELDPGGALGAPHLREVFTHPHPDAGMVFAKEHEYWRHPSASD